MKCQSEHQQSEEAWWNRRVLKKQELPWLRTDGRAPPTSMHTSLPSPGRCAVTAGANRTQEKWALADLGVSTPGGGRGPRGGVWPHGTAARLLTAGAAPWTEEPCLRRPRPWGDPAAWSPRGPAGRATGATTFGKSILGGCGPTCHPSEGQRWTDRPILRDYARLCTARCQEMASTLESWAGGSQSLSPHTQGPQGGACV